MAIPGFEWVLEPVLGLSVHCLLETLALTKLNVEVWRDCDVGFTNDVVGCVFFRFENDHPLQWNCRLRWRLESALLAALEHTACVSSAVSCLYWSHTAHIEV